MALTPSTLTTVSDVTESMPLSPAQLNQRFDALDKNINEVNSTNTVTVGVRLEVERSDLNGVMQIPSGLGALQIGTTSDLTVQFLTNSLVRWNMSSEGSFLPQSDGDKDIGSPTFAVRRTYTNQLLSLQTVAATSSIADGELGLVFAASGMSLIVRSDSTVYDIGSATSAAV